MARLNPNYVNTITLFNCLRGADNPAGTADVWQKTVIDDCFFKCVQQTANSGTSAQAGGTYTVRIPASTKYKRYADWCKLTALQRAGFFTMKEGDIVVLGNSAETITNSSPNTSAHVLARNKPNAFKVTAISENTTGMQLHYRLGG